MAIDIQRPPAGVASNGLDLAERGKAADGSTVRLDRRLFVRLLAYTGCPQPDALIPALEATGLPGALYASAQDPQGIALLTFDENPDIFVGTLRDLLTTPPFDTLTPQPHLTMFGRTYSIGYESDLEETLIHRPIRTMTTPDWPWAVWYPLRRKGSFEQLSAQEQRTVLMEHGGIGRAYGRNDYAHDIRLACHGLDANDNDFVVGLVGKALHPLSAVVQRMRRTKQTSTYLDKLGPFFVGKAVWQRAAASTTNE